MVPWVLGANQVVIDAHFHPSAPIIDQGAYVISALNVVCHHLAPFPCDHDAMSPVRLQFRLHKPVVHYISPTWTATRITKPFLPLGRSCLPSTTRPTIRSAITTMSSHISLPLTQKALTVQKTSESNPNKDQYPFDAVVTEKQITELKPNELLVKVNAVGFNHKDVSAPQVVEY